MTPGHSKGAAAPITSAQKEASSKTILEDKSLSKPPPPLPYSVDELKDLRYFLQEMIQEANILNSGHLIQ